MLARIAGLLIGYCFGLIQTAYIFGKARNVDIRKKGSGNAGATNILRVFGTKAGVFVFFGDFLKAFAAVMITRLIFKNSNPDVSFLISMYAGIGCILGHDFPFYLGFKGGKGVACTVGVMGTCSWIIILFGFITFIPQYLITKYISVSSMLLSAGFFVMNLILSLAGYYDLSAPQLWELNTIIFLIMALTIFSHRQNIKRLIAGNENKTYLKKKN